MKLKEVSSWVIQNCDRATDCLVSTHLDELGIGAERLTREEVIETSVIVFMTASSTLADLQKPGVAAAVVVPFDFMINIPEISALRSGPNSLRSLWRGIEPPSLYVCPKEYLSQIDVTREEHRIPLEWDDLVTPENLVYVRLWREREEINDGEPYSGALYMHTK